MDALQLSFCPPCSAGRTDADGNCQFKALSTSCFGTDNRHLRIRRVVCDYMERNWDKYKESVTTSDYVDRMRRPGTWGDHLTLDAFCNAYGENVIVMRPDGSPTLLQSRTGASSNGDWKAIVYSASRHHYTCCDPWFATPTSQYIEKWKAS